MDAESGHVSCESERRNVCPYVDIITAVCIISWKPKVPFFARFGGGSESSDLCHIDPRCLWSLCSPAISPSSIFDILSPLHVDSLQAAKDPQQLCSLLSRMSSAILTKHKSCLMTRANILHSEMANLVVEYNPMFKIVAYYHATTFWHGTTFWQSASAGSNL
jgi:hypothetical protein